MPSKKKKSIENNLNLKKIHPLTHNQERTFEEYSNKNNLVLQGYAGTGKTYISAYLACNEILTTSSIYDKIIIIRSVVQSRDMGFLPGSIQEKIAIYEEPYREIINKLFDRGDAYELLKLKNFIQFTTTSFLRGITFEKTIVIVDEIQNMAFHELDTIMTRMGENSKIIFCGDFKQTDLTLEREKKGLSQFLNIIKKMKSFKYIEFTKDDIVRSGLVKEYIINKME